MQGLAPQKKYVATFYLKKRKKDGGRLAYDPLMRRYRWFIAYFRTDPSGAPYKLIKVYFSKSEAFRRSVLGDSEIVLLLPAQRPEYYVEFAREIGATALLTRKRKIPLSFSEQTTIRVPYIVFDEDWQGHFHMLFSTVLATVKTPSSVYRSLANEIVRRGIWSDRLGIACMDRFNEVNKHDYLSSGVKWVMRVGRAYRILYGLE